MPGSRCRSTSRRPGRDDRQSLETLERFAGGRPKGWLGPGLTETYETPDLLAAAGIKYIGDWVYDDEPTEIRTSHGPLITLPIRSNSTTSR